VQATDAAALAGKRVAVQGLGRVGRYVLSLLATEGAQILVSDIDAQRVDAVVTKFDVTAVPVESLLLSAVDVLCPRAAGVMIAEAVFDKLKARYIIGAANNLLADPTVADHLAERRVVHVPDFVANAGGLVACDAELRGDDSPTCWIVSKASPPPHTNSCGVPTPNAATPSLSPSRSLRRGLASLFEGDYSLTTESGLLLPSRRSAWHS
jgi:glutamate dehydrogenase/leucine dehydrogenase